MTEKRFAVTQTTFGSGIYDYQAEDTLCESYDEDAYREVCKKLNEFDKENKELKKRDDLVSSYLRDEGSITLEKYNEIVDYLYKEWKKRRLIGNE